MAVVYTYVCVCSTQLLVNTYEFVFDTIVKNLLVKKDVAKIAKQGP